MTEKEFDNIIKQKLESIQDEPPAYMWDKVATALPTTGAATSGMALWLKTLLVASVVIALIGGFFMLVDRNHAPEKRALAPVEKQVSRKQAKNTSAHVGQPATQVQSAGIEKTTVTSTSKQKTPKRINKTNRPANTGTSQNLPGAEKSDKAVAKTEKREPFESTIPESENHAKRKAEAEAEVLALSTAAEDNKLDQGENRAVKNPTEQAQVNGQSIGSSDENLATDDLETESVTATNANITEASIEESAAPEVLAEVVEEEGPAVEESPEQEAEGNVAVEEKTESKKQENSDVSIENPKYRVLNKYSLGLHYGPEFISLNDMNFTDQAVDLSFNYQNLKFIFQTGLGVRFSQDRVNYDMRYKKWEYLETQIRFDSATFVIDANGNPVLVPVNPYYEDVYDSVQHDYYSTAKVNYTILQIPLNVGYQIDRKHWGFYVKGGIRYSLIVYQNTKGLMEPGQGTYTEYLNYPKPQRTRSNLDYELALGLSYRFTKRLSLQLEGYGRLYQYSIFNENPPSGDYPTSYSVRAGLIYSIKQ